MKRSRSATRLSVFGFRFAETKWNKGIWFFGKERPFAAKSVDGALAKQRKLVSADRRAGSPKNPPCTDVEAHG